MKKVFLAFATVCTLAAFQSCTPKCGHCHTETTYTVTGGSSTTTKDDGSTYCGDNSNESGSYSKAAELNCKEWAANQPVVTGYTYASSWVADK